MRLPAGALTELVAQAKRLADPAHPPLLCLWICCDIAGLVRDMSDDPDVLLFVGIDSECDALLIAAPDDLLSPQNAAHRDAQAADYWSRIKDETLAAAARLIERFKPPARPLELLIGQRILGLNPNDLDAGIHLLLTGGHLTSFTPYLFSNVDRADLGSLVGATILSIELTTSWLKLELDGDRRILIDVRDESADGPEILSMDIDGHLCVIRPGDP